jgi:hypothetical protein
MSQKVPIRMPVGSPASAFLSTSASPAMPVPRPPTEPPAVAPSRPPVLAPPQPPSVVTPVVTPAAPSAMSPKRTADPQEAQVRFQVYLPQSLAARIDAEIERRKAAGRRGRGKSDYSAIFRELVDRYL